MNPKVDFFFDKAGRWKDIYAYLRSLILDCGLVEELKWGVPCYTHNGKNIVLIHGFKEYCAILFHKGALLLDEEGLLIQQTKNVQSARQMRFTDINDVHELSALICKYIFEAVEVEKAGLKVPLKKTVAYPVAEEFKSKLEAMPALAKAFKKLTPGRQRAYLLYFSQAKQSKTRSQRVEKYISEILEGRGLQD